MKNLFLISILILCLGCSKEEVTPTVSSLQVISYGPNERNVMDFIPGSETGYLFIHGGGWALGDKSDWGKVWEIVAGKGYSYASINYRLSNQTDWRGMQEDVHLAVEKFKQLGVKKVILVGASAGTHMALLYSISHPVHEIIIVGTVLTTDSLLTSDLDPFVNKYGHVDLIDSTFTCPITTVHGTADNIVYIQQSEILSSKEGVTFLPIQGMKHVVSQSECYDLFRFLIK